MVSIRTGFVIRSTKGRISSKPYVSPEDAATKKPHLDNYERGAASRRNKPVTLPTLRIQQDR